MTGAIETGAQVTLSFMDSLKREPLSLALVVMNLALLGFFYVLLTRVAEQRKTEVALLYSDHKEVRELLARCVIPDRRSEFRPDLWNDPPKPSAAEETRKPVHIDVPPPVEAEPQLVEPSHE